MDALVTNLEYLMTVSGLTSQSLLSKATGVSQTHIGNILRHDKLPGVHVLERLAHGLNVEVWQLLAPPALLQRGLSRPADQLLRDWLNCDDEGRRTISAVARAQAASVPGRDS